LAQSIITLFADSLVHPERTKAITPIRTRKPKLTSLLVFLLMVFTFWNSTKSKLLHATTAQVGHRYDGVQKT
jgi:hypothetical protein